MSEDSKRVEWTDPQDNHTYWAELSAHAMTWGQRNKARKAAVGDFWTVFAPALVTLTVTKWSESDDPSDEASWDKVPGEFGDEVFSTALVLWKDYQERAAKDPTERQSAS